MTMNEEMDLDDWEFLLSPRHHHEYDAGFFDYHHDDDDGDALAAPQTSVLPSFSPSTTAVAGFDTKIVLNMNYFICPSSSSSTSPPLTKSTIGGAPPLNQLVPPAQFVKEGDEITLKVSVEIGVIPRATIAEKLMIKKAPVNSELPEADNDDDGDTVPHHHVFFKKIIKETEFVDMKLDLDSPPKFASSSIFMPQDQKQIDATSTTFVPFDQGNNKTYTQAASPYNEGDNQENCNHSSSTTTKIMKIDTQAIENSDVNDEKEAISAWGEQGSQKGPNSNSLNHLWWWKWRWGFTGIGALCSFGVAATTICILIFGTHHHHHSTSKHHHHHSTSKHHHQKLRHLHQIHTHDDKRIKQVVQHAARLNMKDATISAAVRGVPLTSAHISFGGVYYDGLQN